MIKQKTQEAFDRMDKYQEDKQVADALDRAEEGAKWCNKAYDERWF